MHGYRLLFNEKLRKCVVFQLIEKAERKLDEISTHIRSVKGTKGNEKAKEKCGRGRGWLKKDCTEEAIARVSVACSSHAGSQRSRLCNALVGKSICHIAA